jgi:hypothetical protein
MRIKQSYPNLSMNIHQFNSVVGLELEHFNDLSIHFEKQMAAYDKAFTIKGVARTRSVRRRKDNNFSCHKDKLCFILSYLKNNSLQQTHASNWGMLQPRANIWIHLLLKILLETLEEIKEVPASNSDELAELLTQTKLLFLDGTE